MKSRKFGPNTPRRNPDGKSSLETIKRQEHSARTKLARKGAHKVRDQRVKGAAATGQSAVLRDSGAPPTKLSQGRSNGVPIYAPIRREQMNPHRPGIFESGRKAKHSGFAAFNPQVIPTGSQSIARPLTGKRLF